MRTNPLGVDPVRLADEGLRRDLAHPHRTRHDTVPGESEAALLTHNDRMVSPARELLRRFPLEGAPDRMCTRAVRRRAARPPDNARAVIRRNRCRQSARTAQSTRIRSHPAVSAGVASSDRPDLGLPTP
jgi:hypothetical protein